MMFTPRVLAGNPQLGPKNFAPLSQDVCGGAFPMKIDEESKRWSRIVRATGFTAAA